MPSKCTAQSTELFVSLLYNEAEMISAVITFFCIYSLWCTLCLEISCSNIIINKAFNTP